MAGFKQFPGMLDEPPEPRELVVKLGPRLRVAVWQIQATDDNPECSRFEIAAMVIRRIARKSAATFNRVRALGKNRYAVPRALAMPYCAVTCIANFRDGEARVERLEFLEAHDLR